MTPWVAAHSQLFYAVLAREYPSRQAKYAAAAAFCRRQAQDCDPPDRALWDKAADDYAWLAAGGSPNTQEDLDDVTTIPF
jgi:hypothetical protein